MSRPSQHSQPKGPCQRQLRVAEEIRHILAGILMRGELRDPELAGVSITVSEVRISPDLKNATVFTMPLGGTHLPEVLKALNRIKPYLRSQLGKEMSLRYTPDLNFIADNSFAEANRIDELLRSDKVARDLKKKSRNEKKG